MSVGDIYYILFRHKWKILSIAGAGLLIALALPFILPRPYQSEAKLFIKYVVESRGPSIGQGGANDAKVKSPDERGDNIINTELEILTSLDLAREVATNLPPEILSKLSPTSQPYEAANNIRRSLLPEVPKKSDVIRIICQNRDPATAQLVLSRLIDVYVNRHGQIHHAVGVYDSVFTEEKDKLRKDLADTEELLRKAKTNAQIISLQDDKKLYTEQMGRLQQQIFDIQADLAERRSALEELTKALRPEKTNSTLGATNVAVFGPAIDPQSNAVAAVAITPAPSEKTSEYKRISSLLDALYKQEQDYTRAFTPENTLVKSTREQIATNERAKQQLETEFPSLLAVKTPEQRITEAVTGPKYDLLAEAAKVKSLEAKYNMLTNQFATLRQHATRVDDLEGRIIELERQKEVQEKQYKYFSENLAQSRIDESLATARQSNIQVIQTPSPAFRDSSKLRKAMAGAFIGSIALALALVFGIEFYLDRSLRRPADIEHKLGLHLFLTIPLLSQNGNGKVKLLPGRKRALIGNGASHPEQSEGSPSPAPSDAPDSAIRNSPFPIRSSEDSPFAIPSEIPPWNPRHKLRPFYEALRDRLILYFEAKNLTHKPKLVAVTSCAEGSGVSTTAAGLAASLSETGEGNVLLVDMNLKGAAHQFFKGRLTFDIDDALQMDKRSGALVQENLYVVSESSGDDDTLPRVLPSRFKHLVPRLKASDYDYIIFDLPPVSHISSTPRLAKFMDMMFFVVESEKSDVDVVRKATSLLLENTQNLGIVLNKAKSYVPKQLQQEL
jgi:uncharacterized protein involved in exopolysaccharide biosynthesis/Mrp family chromosome partitioning ATPase